MFTWSVEKEKEVIQFKQEGLSYPQIAERLGTSATSVKHKLRRLQQNDNQDRYKHTFDKVEQLQKFLPCEISSVLETNAGFGGLTSFYCARSKQVTCLELDGERVQHLTSSFPSVKAVKCNSEKEIYKLLATKKKYQVIDLDPYGFPSKFFPHVFELIDDGFLVVTFPVMGVAQINKIMVQHYKSFWDISLSDKPRYLAKIQTKLFDYGFMSKRSVELLDVLKISRIYRFVIRVKKTSLLDIVGLTVNRKNKQLNPQPQPQLMSFPTQPSIPNLFEDN